MSTYRIYVDSRHRRSGTVTNFEYALPYSLTIKERSLAMIDAVVIPNSIKQVGPRNNMIYVRETATIGDDVEVRLRYPTIPQGYYTVETLRVAIQTALNGPDRFIPGVCVVTYNEVTARFEFRNDATRFNDIFVLYTKKRV